MYHKRWNLVTALVFWRPTARLVTIEPLPDVVSANARCDLFVMQ